jgi:para-aminobenzoate synthetase
MLTAAATHLGITSATSESTSASSDNSQFHGIRCLIIDNYDSFTHNLVEYFSILTKIHPITLYNTVPFSYIESILPYIDCIILSPGPGNPQHPADVGVCTHILNDQYILNNIPILGVCLGLQLLAACNQGNIIHAYKPQHGQISAISHNSKQLFKNIPNPMLAVRYNSLIVGANSVNSNLIITATDEVNEIMGLDHKDYPIYTVQFHPESIETQHGMQMFSNFIDLIIQFQAKQRIQHKTMNQMQFEAAVAALKIEKNYWSGRCLTEIELSSPSSTISNYYFPGKPQHYGLLSRKLSGEAYVDSEQVFASLFAGASSSFWLDSSLIEQGRSRFSFCGDFSGPHSIIFRYFLHNQTVTAASNSSEMYETIKLSEQKGLFFGFLQQFLNQHVVISDEHESSALPFDFQCGLVGYFGYEMKEETQPHPGELHDSNIKPSPSASSNIPDALFGFADRMIAFDHTERAIYILALHSIQLDNSREEKVNRQEQNSSQSHIATDNWLKATAQQILQLKSKPFSAPRTTPANLEPNNNNNVQFEWRDSRAEYIDKINSCKASILEGESYELCLTNKLLVSIRNSPHFSPFQFYRILRRLNAAPYSSYFNFPEFSLCSSSPERFLRVSSTGQVQSKPIKGTVPRGSTASLDAELKLKLATSQKDRSENLMIVDLIRNDLSKIGVTGSVAVPALMQVESYATVHQLVSTIEAKIDTKMIQPLQVIEHCFPPGSMTGAPKLRSTVILKGLEQEKRGIYSGTLGYIGLNGTADMNVIIRTAILPQPSKDNPNAGYNVSIGAGGAIVHLSNSEEEYEEVLLKAKALINALKVAAAEELS